MSRRRLIQAVNRRIGDRRLVWYGVRGADAEALTCLGNFRESFSVTAPLGAGIESEECLEVETGIRVDLNTYDYEPTTPQLLEFYRRLGSALRTRCVVVPYRSTQLLSSWCQRPDSNIAFLGLFHQFQSLFDNKFWVDLELSRRSVPMLPWRYITPDGIDELRDAVARQPHAARRSQSSGGTGLRLLTEQTEVDTSLWTNPEAVLAYCPMFEGVLSCNVGATVDMKGAVSLHGPSVQLVGVPELVRWPFGYCGNDFAQVCQLDGPLLDQLEAIVRQVGSWLAWRGYVGAFGVDALLREGRFYFVEVNPRFQGSSAVSARLDIEMDRPDIFLSHIAAFLGVDITTNVRLRDLAREQPPRSVVYCYNTTDEGQILADGETPAGAELMPSPGVVVDPGALLFSWVTPGAVTATGSEIGPSHRAAVRDIRRLAQPIGGVTARSTP